MVAAAGLFALVVLLSPSSGATPSGLLPAGSSTSSESTSSTDPEPTDPPTSATPSTEPPTTQAPPTSRSTPTTSRATSTTRRASTTTTEAEQTTTTEESTTTTAPPASLVLPPTETVPPRVNVASTSGLSTDAKLGIVVGGLLAVGVAISVLTYLYWRHTRPNRYLDALGALDSVTEIGPTRNAEEAPAALSVEPESQGDRVPTAVVASPMSAAADPATSGPATASAPVSPVIEEPPTIVTAEDLYGTVPDNGEATDRRG